MWIKKEAYRFALIKLGVWKSTQIVFTNFSLVRAVFFLALFHFVRPEVIHSKHSERGDTNMTQKQNKSEN